MTGEFIKSTTIIPAIIGTIANPDDYNQNIAGQSKDAIVGIDEDGAFKDVDIGDENLGTNGTLINNIKLRENGGGLKIYNASGVLVKTVSLDIFSIADYKYSAQSSNHNSWLKCDGTEISRTTYSALFGIIGTSFGVGNGSTTFNLPDQRGKVPGAIGQGSGLTNRNLGNSVGEENHQLSIAELAQHRHNMTSNATNGGAGTASPYSSVAGPSYTNTDDIQLTGSNVAHNTMQPTLFIGNLFIYSGV